MKESRGITPLRTILQNCLNHIENLETNRSTSDNYDKEFQDLKQFSETLKTQKEYSCTEGEKEVNKKKNRYKDILPFNISRVVLSEYAGIPGSDYINANFIKGASGSPAYIASQGPLPNTVNDFWRMVVECEVQVIVMACNAQESGKHKCENYWVEKEGEEKRFGMVQICLVKASTVCPDFLVRTMRLKYTNDKDVTGSDTCEERTVCQFHYSAWPDHGVPPLVRPLLDMVRLMRDTQASETLPVLVHCSAGCGRTGTICAIDFVWGLLRAGKLTEEFSLFNLVKEMRKQRVAMVQTKEQYILVHQAVRELFKEQLRVIESHPYENIDFNGVPLIKDFEEPFYDTISIQKEENCDEKQDKSEMKDKGEDCERISKIDAAPPLPRKKRPNVLFSKQEKEAENLTEKNRSSFAEKEKEKTEASLSSLLGKPRIVKLRALFEKTPMGKDRAGLKDRGSQTVSRSHSLGAIRKPFSSEIFEPQEKVKPSSHPSDLGKLKHSKSFSRSVPLIKRSKSLKTFSQSPHLCVSPQETVVLKNFKKSFDEEGDNEMWKNPNEGPSKRRRSLESLMGDVQPSVTWPRGIDQKSDLKARQKSLDWSPKLTAAPSTKAADILRHQLQKLSLEREKINSFGIGIRERRNSFRQAVSKSSVQGFENAKGVDQPDGALDRKFRAQDKSDIQMQPLRHRQLERTPKNILTKESTSKNLFLKKLNSELYDNQRDGCQPETRSRIVYEEPDKGSRPNPILVRSDSKKTLFKTNVAIKSSAEVDVSSGRDGERTYQPIWENLQKRPPKSYECYKCFVTSKPSQPSSYQRPISSHKPLSYQNSVDSSLKEQYYSVHKKVPPKETEVTFSSYRKPAELYAMDGSDKKIALPPKLGVGKNSKTYEHLWCHPGSSRSSGEMSSSEHSSDSSRLCQFDGECPAKGEVKVIIKPEPVRSRLGDGSKGNEQVAKSKKPEEFKANTSVEFCNHGIVGTSKIRLNTAEYSKDDFVLKEPTAPPRVKRHASVTVPRNAINGSDRILPWVSGENEAGPIRSAPLQPDKNAWNGTIGVDLDAVAASMQQDKKGVTSALKDGVWSGKNHLGGPTNSNAKKKQHYF